ncbi:MAG TPA: hypothetical protein VF438_03745 [Candidatus Paceibacterota bacterium]
MPTQGIFMDAFLTLSVKADPPEKVRTGAVVAFAMRDLQQPTLGQIALLTYGEGEFEKLTGWLRNAPEKIIRLHRRRREGHPDVTSTESAQPALEDVNRRTYGGSVVFDLTPRTPRYEHYRSVSGGHPLVDEALSYALGCKSGMPPPHIPHQNPYLNEACALLGCPHLHD